MNFKTENIGRIELGVEGSDQYIKLTADGNHAPTKSQVHDWLLSQCYRDTHQEAGGYYCHSVTIMKHPRLNDEFVGIIHHRFDV